MNIKVKTPRHHFFFTIVSLIINKTTTIEIDDINKCAVPQFLHEPNSKEMTDEKEAANDKNDVIDDESVAIQINE